jgi:hypothetical protein
MNLETAEDHKQLAATVQRAIENFQAEAANARTERGEGRLVRVACAASKRAAEAIFLEAIEGACLVMIAF